MPDSDYWISLLFQTAIKRTAIVVPNTILFDLKVAVDVA
jgi:hypothetical protein